MVMLFCVRGQSDYIFGARGAWRLGLLSAEPWQQRKAVCLLVRRSQMPNAAGPAVGPTVAASIARRLGISSNGVAVELWSRTGGSGPWIRTRALSRRGREECCGRARLSQCYCKSWNMLGPDHSRESRKARPFTSSFFCCGSVLFDGGFATGPDSRRRRTITVSTLGRAVSAMT